MNDRFQIVLGHYVFYIRWHGGQGTKEYARMSKITKYFTPGFRGLNLRNEENIIAMCVYKNLCDKYGYRDELCD